VTKPQNITSADEGRLLVVKRVAEALAASAADGPDAGAASALQAVCVPLDWQRGEVWVADDGGRHVGGGQVGGGRVRLRWAWYDPADGPAAQRFDSASRGGVREPGVGLVGQVWRTGLPAAVPDLPRDPAFARRPAAAAAGLRSAVAVPIRAAGEGVGVMLLFSRRPRDPDPADHTLLSTVAAQLGLLLARCPPLPVRPDAGGTNGDGGRVADDGSSAADLRAALEHERAARAEAERVSARKDDFVATVSHELRTPLNAILGWAQVLRGARDLAEVNEAVSVIERNARAQARLIEDLLDLSRMVGGEVPLATERVELDQVVEAAIDAVLPDATARRIRIETSIEPFAAPVMGDPARLQQVVWNLLSNAVKYTQEGGRVRVALDADDADDAEATITVSDNGIGIAPETLPHVFDRFRQGTPAARKSGGLGLGLAIVKQLVEMHGGRVRAASDGLGRGTTFTVTLPLAVLFDGGGRPAAVTARPDGASPQLPRLDKVALLVVDDEPDTRRLVERILRDQGAVVTACGSMVEALAALDGGSFDLLVSDIAMPEHDGYELIHRVRQRPADKGGLIRALALTAFARETDLRRSLGAGFNMHVNKPIEAADLLSAVARLLGTKLQP
jgi:signal transduction histidine kinase/ActR/RegA family two-component response regulator